MSHIKLTYFDMPGGRAEPIRIALHSGNIAFEDHRISFEEFGQTRLSTPLNAVPVFEVDGVVYTQTNAMARYVGIKTNLYPQDPWEAFKCDEVMDATEDLMHKIVNTFGLKDETLVNARKALTEGPINRYLQMLESRLNAAGGQYFADKRLTIADLKVFVQLRSLNAGVLDHIPTDLVATVAPGLQAFATRMAEEEAVVNYYSSCPSR